MELGLIGKLLLLIQINAEGGGVGTCCIILNRINILIFFFLIAAIIYLSSTMTVLGWSVQKAGILTGGPLPWLVLSSHPSS